jgi:hypothetical protein
MLFHEVFNKDKKSKEPETKERKPNYLLKYYKLEKDKKEDKKKKYF